MVPTTERACRQHSRAALLGSNAALKTTVTSCYLFTIVCFFNNIKVQHTENYTRLTILKNTKEQ